MRPLDLINRVHFGDAYALIQQWPDEFVDCTVTSPPYWLQRQYIPSDHALATFEMGRESSIDGYIRSLVELFAQVYRITKPGGTAWVNIGDKTAGPDTKKLAPGYQEGELLGLPWKFADVVRTVGWRWVGEVIWHKPNPMTTGHKGCPMPSHEAVIQLAKGNHYYDPYACMEPCSTPGRVRNRNNAYESAVNGFNPPRITKDADYRRPRSVWTIPVGRFNGKKLLADVCEEGIYLDVDPHCLIHGDDPVVAAGPLFRDPDPAPVCSCNLVDVEHFASFPEALAERCILLSTSEIGNCGLCGKPWYRLVEKERKPTRPGTDASIDPTGKSNRDPLRHVTTIRTAGWAKSCGCAADWRTQPVVFDPFAGSGTTPAVAAALGRSYIGTELNPAYAKRLAPARIAAGYERKFPA